MHVLYFFSAASTVLIGLSTDNPLLASDPVDAFKYIVSSSMAGGTYGAICTPFLYMVLPVSALDCVGEIIVLSSTIFDAVFACIMPYDADPP